MMQWIGGYSAALTVHGLDEGFELGIAGPFTNWLSWNYGTSLSGGWVAAVEQLAQEGESSVEAFFQLLDAYRAESAAI
ncbi:hypothetical protein [Embleya scabrispora]|uniref:hypothetical protein n=1 Tax=Embleya scabrispora TaxID=159449 RepID=UPI0039C8758D